jgi:hypothetical protein
MSVMGGRWAAVGNNRLTKFLRVLPREWCCTPAMLCARGRKWVEDDRAKV